MRSIPQRGTLPQFGNSKTWLTWNQPPNSGSQLHIWRAKLSTNIKIFQHIAHKNHKAYLKKFNFLNFLQKLSYCQIYMSGLQRASVNLVRYLMRSLHPQSASLHQKHWRQPEAFRSSILYVLLNNLMRDTWNKVTDIYTHFTTLCVW